MVPTQESPPAGAVRPAQGGIAEPRAQRLRRHGRRQVLYLRAAVVVALLGVLIALIAANTRQVQLDWVIGTTQMSLVWIVFFSAVMGGVVGVVGSALLRRRTRRTFGDEGAARTATPTTKPATRGPA